jgi:hypothetical protein
LSIWNAWHLKKFIFSGTNFLGFNTKYIFYPQAGSLILHNYTVTTSLLCLPFQYIFGPIVARNLIFLIEFALTGLQKEHAYYRCTKKLTNCSQKHIREEELEKDKAHDVQSSRPHQQNFERQISDIDAKINKLIDIYLEGNITLEEYKRKKEDFIKACGMEVS